MGRYKYPKMITINYNREIKWKGNTGSVEVAPNDEVDFVTNDRGQYRGVHTADGSMILNRARKPVKYHICGMNHYIKKCP